MSSREQKEVDAEQVARNDRESTKQITRLLKGMRVRDEFLCPITFEIMMDAVVAADGHSYERSAITKWMATKDNSPRTGEALEHKNLVPNSNLRRIIQDMISEGGAGLYTHDVSDRGRMIELSKQKLLVMLCLGPPESEWNQRNFQVTPAGCLGGRKMPENLEKEFIVFKDTTVSRRHFEISYDTGRSKYTLRDLGSAGGSFVRIPFGVKKVLHPGMILLMGKHQFTVSSVDAHTPSDVRPTSFDDGGLKTLSPGDEKFSFQPRVVPEGLDDGANDSALAEIMDDAEAFLDMLEQHASKSSVRADAKGGAADSVDRSVSIKNKLNSLRADFIQKQQSSKLAGITAEAKHDSGEEFEAKDGSSGISYSKFSGYNLTLTCFAPDASPMQGRNFHIGIEGATVGRRSQCTICMCIKGDDKLNLLAGKSIDSDKVLNIDSAVSTDHARINLDTETGEFYVMDGSASKPSTNGTWYRLSGPHQESPHHDLTPNMEVLLGTVRFQVSEAETIAERAVLDSR